MPLPPEGGPAGAGPGTIFALASGAPPAAIAVLRLSGPGTAATLASLAGGPPPPRRATLRRLRGADGETLDRALVLWFPGPASFTGEDAAELHVHGGRAVVEGVAAALLALGLRPAEPGEFTRRAFLHGRLDLTAAEGLADLVAASTPRQRRQALAQAEGALAALYDGWGTRLTGLLAGVEASLEFAEDGTPEAAGAGAAPGLDALRREVAAHLADGGRGRAVRDGVRVAIVGAPNAGKSSLLNALCGRGAAIVADRPGTTRDVVEVRLELTGVPVTLADTAGLRAADDAVEAEGVRRALAWQAAADLTLAVFAPGAPPDAATLALGGGGRIAVASKADLGAAAPLPGGEVALAVSAVTGEGVAALRARLAAAVAGLADGAGEAPLTRARHRAALEETLGWLERAGAEPLPEMAAEALRAALRALGRLTGRGGVEEVLDAVFREFCVGK